MKEAKLELDNMDDIYKRIFYSASHQQSHSVSRHKNSGSFHLKKIKLPGIGNRSTHPLKDSFDYWISQQMTTIKLLCNIDQLDNSSFVPALISPYPINLNFFSNLRLKATFSPRLVQTGMLSRTLIISYIIITNLHPWL